MPQAEVQVKSKRARAYRDSQFKWGQKNRALKAALHLSDVGRIRVNLVPIASIFFISACLSPSKLALPSGNRPTGNVDWGLSWKVRFVIAGQRVKTVTFMLPVTDKATRVTCPHCAVDLSFPRLTLHTLTCNSRFQSTVGNIMSNSWENNDNKHYLKSFNRFLIASDVPKLGSKHSEVTPCGDQ